MVKSNADRQREFRQRRNAAASQGVTAEMIEEARRVLYRLACEQNQEVADWPAFLVKCQKRNGADSWAEMLPDDTRPDAYDWVEDAAERALLEKVAPVARAVLRVPERTGSKADEASSEAS